jgi:hypothetical protein
LLLLLLLLLLPTNESADVEQQLGCLNFHVECAAPPMPQVEFPRRLGEVNQVRWIALIGMKRDAPVLLCGLFLSSSTPSAHPSSSYEHAQGQGGGEGAAGELGASEGRCLRNCPD